MRVLILSCATGEGHNSAAKAIYEYFQMHHTECDVVDTLSLISPAVSQKASDIYVFSTKTKLFELIYNTGALVSRKKSKSPVYFANKLYCGRLLEYIDTNKYDTIICTHLFPAEAITALIRLKELSAKTVFVFTDYTCIPFVSETQLDHYIIPHEHLIEECVKKGLERSKLLPYGIPVKQIFYSSQSRVLARKECKQLFGERINENAKWLLIMSGSMGFGNLKDLVKQTISECGMDAELFLVCGNNTRLQKTLTEEFANNKNITVLGFTDKIPALMDACDVLFTKPGGLSSTEAAAKNIPIIHTAPIPGCETRNAEFFHYHGMSYSTSDIKEQVRQALRLCDDKPYREKMISFQKMHINPDTSRDILNICSGQGKIK
ncbi:MAG TPA: glycosyltransferase [Bacteroidales bacterium]|nr:glycosyltransferase [Bacteroidales bacterium]